MFQKWYSLPNAQGQMTTYSRIGWRYYRGPSPNWGYGETRNEQYPDLPLNEFRWRVERLTAQLPITPTSRILVLACGVGFLPEAFIWWQMSQGETEAAAKPRVAGVDNSAYIQSVIPTTADPLMMIGTTPKIVNRSFQLGTANNQMRNSLRSAAGNSEFFDFVILESVDESYTDVERSASWHTAIESYLAAGRSKANIIHMVFEDDVDRYGSPGWDPVPDGGAQNKTLDAWAQTRPSHTWVSCVGEMRTLVGTG